MSTASRPHSLSVSVAENDLLVYDVVDLVSGHRWCSSSTGAPLFRYRIVAGGGQEVVATSAGGIANTRIVDELPGILRVQADAIGQPVRFTIEIDTRDQLKTRFGAVAENLGAESLNVELRLPWLSLSDSELYVATGAVPIEIGAVNALRRGPIRNSADFTNPTFACATSSFPLAHVGHTDLAGGLMIAGDPSFGGLHIVEAGAEGFGLRRTVFLMPGTSADLGQASLSATVADWESVFAEDVLGVTAETTDSPEWFRRCGAIYNPLAEGGGGIYQIENTVPLASRIGSFRELPSFLDEAEELGSTVLHLFDYWEAPDPDERPPYWHKGDYIPRRDLGGAEALQEGIASVQARGGRVILYLEPFIIYRRSLIGEAEAEHLAIRDPWTSRTLDIYPDNISPAPWDPAWREWIVWKARSLVSTLGADGVFLDSFGWQWNWVCSVAGGRVHDAREWNEAVVSLCSEVRDAVTSERPDAIVMTESLTAPLYDVVDGGLDASFAWNRDLNAGQLLQSPIRRTTARLSYFSSGSTLNELDQVFANGLNLALSRRWSADKDHVAELVHVRREYADALVDGRQSLLALSPDSGAGAFQYTGAKSTVLILVNSSDIPRQLEIQADLMAESGWFPLTRATERRRPVPDIELPTGALFVWGRAT